MIKKNRKSKEQYQKELENRYLKKDQNKETRESIAEGRAEFIRQVKNIKSEEQEFQEKLSSNCAYCSSQSDHFVPIEYTTENFTYQSIEEVVAEVICPNPCVFSTRNSSEVVENTESDSIESSSNCNSEEHSPIAPQIRQHQALPKNDQKLDSEIELKPLIQTKKRVLPSSIKKRFQDLEFVFETAVENIIEF